MVQLNESHPTLKQHQTHVRVEHCSLSSSATCHPPLHHHPSPPPRHAPHSISPTPPPSVPSSCIGVVLERLWGGRFVLRSSSSGGLGRRSRLGSLRVGTATPVGVLDPRRRSLGLDAVPSTPQPHLALVLSTPFYSRSPCPCPLRSLRPPSSSPLPPCRGRRKASRGPCRAA